MGAGIFCRGTGCQQRLLVRGAPGRRRPRHGKPPTAGPLGRSTADGRAESKRKDIVGAAAGLAEARTAPVWRRPAEASARGPETRDGATVHGTKERLSPIQGEGAV